MDLKTWQDPMVPWSEHGRAIKGGRKGSLKRQKPAEFHSDYQCAENQDTPPSQIFFTRGVPIPQEGVSDYQPDESENLILFASEDQDFSLPLPRNVDWDSDSYVTECDSYDYEWHQCCDKRDK